MEHKWYVLNVHAGKEEFIADKIKSMVDAQKLKKIISEIYVPLQTKIVIKDGKKSIQKKRLLPGYILIKLDYSDSTASLITSIREVRGFTRQGDEVYPLPQEEVDKMMNKKAEGKEDTKVTYVSSVRLHDAVKITDGPFKDFIGKIANVDESKGEVQVLITMFGQETPCELKLTQIKKL